jgi:Holliday junction resolvasome RuvABC endonuclease subunit
MGDRLTITCLDLATKTGVAYGLAGGKPTLETWDLRAAEERPAKLVLLDQMLDRHIAAFRPSMIYYEAPLPLSVLMAIGATESTIQMLRSLAAVVEQAAWRNEVGVGSWPVQTARQAVIGRGRFPRGEAKRHVMAFCRLLRYAPNNDNEADSIIGFLYQSALLNPRTAHLSTPLFATG